MGLLAQTELIRYLTEFIMLYGLQTVLEWGFYNRFTRTGPKVLHYVFYTVIVFLIMAALPYAIVKVAVLTVFGAWLYRLKLNQSFLVATLAVIVMMLSNGMSVPIEMLVVQCLPLGGNVLLVPIILGIILPPVFSFITYRLILNKFKSLCLLPYHYLTIFLIPVLLLLFIEGYISNTIYGSEVIIEDFKIVKPVVNNWQILAIQAVSYVSLFCILYACDRLSEDFVNRTQLALLEQETQAQKNYVDEARARYEQTRSFRHDIRNHLSVLEGLLQSEQIEQARSYLKNLSQSAESLSLPFQTNNSVIDILLGSKYELARQKGIRLSCSLVLPSSCGINDLDLCIIFSNAVDNAVKGCEGIRTASKFIQITGKRQGDFLLVDFINSWTKEGDYEKGNGIGLSNIRAVVKKYQGAVSIEEKKDSFRLSLMLVIKKTL